jgi:hypothetical protein
MTASLQVGRFNIKAKYNDQVLNWFEVLQL